MQVVWGFDGRFSSTRKERGTLSRFPAGTSRVPEHEELRSSYAQHYALCLLAFATGLRPSSLRPLRRKGPQADIKWDDGILLVRRSHTRGDEVVETPKMAQHQRLHLPKTLVEVLEEHTAMIDREPHVIAARFATAERDGDGAAAFRHRQVLERAKKVAASEILFRARRAASGRARASTSRSRPW